MNQDQHTTLELMIILAVGVMALAARNTGFLKALFTRQPFTVQGINWPPLKVNLIGGNLFGTK